MQPDNPIIVQADRSVLVDVHAPRYEEARARLGRFAELEKSPEHMHTYRLSPLALWNAAATGLTAAEVAAALVDLARYPVPSTVLTEVAELIGRFGKIRLDPGVGDGPLSLRFADAALAETARRHKTIGDLLSPSSEKDVFLVSAAARGVVKQQLLKIGFPVDDRAGFTAGRALPLRLREVTRRGRPFALRPYQRDAARAFLDGGAVTGGAGGHGVVVLPCGAGKTVVAMAAMATLGCETLILTTSITAARQWIDELRDKTDIADEAIGEYSGEVKLLRPITVATYHILTHKQGARFPHFERLSKEDFGLIVYDEVHLLPAPVFRLTAEIQARRRLGLTATLVREDRQEGDVFTLIGPKRFDVPWKEIEAQGFIAEATCYELRVPMPGAERAEYDAAEPAHQHRLAAGNSAKLDEVARLVAMHPREPTLVIGVYLDQLEATAARLGVPLLTGQTPQRERERLLDRFRRGEERVLVLSRVGNFSIDLPDASVCIQIAGTFGSRQEEAQRLGRILRPAEGGGKAAVFYSLVSRDTVEQQHAMNRQLFLTEQGYRYYIEEVGAAAAAVSPAPETGGGGAKILQFPSRIGRDGGRS